LADALQALAALDRTRSLVEHQQFPLL
jgi:hypothetical protein